MPTHRGQVNSIIVFVDSEAIGSYAENQRITAVRKVYQRGVVNPMINIELLWKEYCNFEHVRYAAAFPPSPLPLISIFLLSSPPPPSLSLLKLYGLQKLLLPETNLHNCSHEHFKVKQHDVSVYILLLQV